MPNIVKNRININGDKENITKFLDTMEMRGDKYYFDFGQTVPVDPECPPDFYDSGELDANSCWGTKWGLNAVVCDITDTSIGIQIDTAWEPPITWAINACCNYDVKIDIHYVEEGSFYGSYTDKDGDNRKYYTKTSCLQFDEDDDTHSYDVMYPIGDLKNFVETHDIEINF